MVWSQGTSSCGLVGSTKVASGEEVRQGDTELGQGMGTEHRNRDGMGTQRWERASGWVPLLWGRVQEQGQTIGTETGQGTETGMGLTGLPIAAGPPALLVGTGPGVGVVSH